MSQASPGPKTMKNPETINSCLKNLFSSTPLTFARINAPFVEKGLKSTIAAAIVTAEITPIAETSGFCNIGTISGTMTASIPVVEAKEERIPAI